MPQFPLAAIEAEWRQLASIWDYSNMLNSFLSPSETCQAKMTAIKEAVDSIGDIGSLTMDITEQQIQKK